MCHQLRLCQVLIPEDESVTFAKKNSIKGEKICDCLYYGKGFCKDHQVKACEQCMSACGNCDLGTED